MRDSNENSSGELNSPWIKTRVGSGIAGVERIGVERTGRAQKAMSGCHGCETGERHLIQQRCRE